MTTYTTITAGEVDADSPLTATLAAKWRDNPIATAEQILGGGAPAISLVQIGSVTATGGESQLTLTDSFQTDMILYLIVGYDFDLSTDSQASLQLRERTTDTWRTAGYTATMNWAHDASATWTAQAGEGDQDGIPLTGRQRASLTTNQVDMGTGSNQSFYAFVTNPWSNGLKTTVIGQSFIVDSVQQTAVHYGGRYDTTEGHDSIRFDPEGGGTVSAGCTMILFGLPHVSFTL